LNPIVLQTGLTVLFGAIAGGATNAIAVWMLFHPYEPPKLFGRPLRLLQGAIPKSKARLASAIGRTVGTKLLTSEDLARTVAQPAFKEAFDERLGAFIRSLIDEDRTSLSGMLPPALADELRVLLGEVGTTLVSRLDDYLAADDFRAAAHRWAETLADEVRDKPLSDLLTL
jgi:uncharacterized membrane protein YheB (UPF0754 family)